MSTCDRQRKQKKNKQTNKQKTPPKNPNPHQYGRRNLSY